MRHREPSTPATGRHGERWGYLGLDTRGLSLLFLGFVPGGKERRTSQGGRVKYAVIRTGGLQFKVAEGDRIRVPRMRTDVGSNIEVPEVLAVGGDGETTLGTPLVAGAKVSAEVLRHGRGTKVIIYKKRRRKTYQRKGGHRQDYTELKITGIAL
jgi:large subunit ribosomal protein L21